MSDIGEIQPSQITISKIHTNTELTLIQITEDKLRLTLIENLRALEQKNRWQVPLGVILTIVPLLLTSDFKDFASIDKTTWRAFFMFLAFGSAVWFVFTLSGAFKSITLDDLVQKLKNVARLEA